MPDRWICIEFPASHGSFPQAGLDELERVAPDMQPPRPRSLPGMSATRRYSCPRCVALGKDGAMRPTEITHQPAGE